MSFVVSEAEDVGDIFNNSNATELYKKQNNIICDSQNIELSEDLTKKRKVDDFTKLINDHISAYREWYNSTFSDIRKFDEPTNPFVFNDHKPANNLFSQNYLTYEYYNQCGYPILENIQPHVTGSFQMILQQQQRQDNNSKNHKKQAMGYWGPLLRYGTYGVYQIHKKSSSISDFLRKKEIQSLKSDSQDRTRTILRFPLNLPMHIRLPRQAMICTLQAKAKARLHDLRKAENDPVLHMNINYSHQLEQITKQCGTCPKYLYIKVNSLPSMERGFFTFLNCEESSAKSFLSLDGSVRNEIKSTNNFFGCELLIGDIIISQGFALWKRRSREICAKNAFSVLEKPCHMVSSIRYWYGTEYLTACTTTDPTIVPILPPFLTDPTEPLYKKDEKINESDPDENFNILNPKPLNDFWLYVPTLKQNDNIKSIDPQTILYQSAEFSQMNLSFEVETCWDESFACTVIIDKTPAVRVEGLGSLEQACQASALVLVDKLVDTQPIVVLQEMYHQQYSKLGISSNDNSFLVHSLMWGRQYLNNPIDFKELTNRIADDSLVSSTSFVSSSTQVTSVENLDRILIMYAQSSLVNPVRLLPEYLSDQLWFNVGEQARKSGLISMIEGNVDDENFGRQRPQDLIMKDDLTTMNRTMKCSILISKQVPHTQLKAMLMKQKRFGAFSLISQGNLDGDYLLNLEKFVCYGDNSVDIEEPLSCAAKENRFDGCSDCQGANEDNLNNNFNIPPSPSIDCDDEPLGFLLLGHRNTNLGDENSKDVIPGLDL